MPAAPTPRLTEEQAAFITGAVSITMASRNAAMRCSVVRGLGCEVLPSLDTVRLFVNASQAAGVLADITACPQLAVVFCLPSTNRTLQLKTMNARAEALEARDLTRIRAHTEAFVAEVMPLEECSEDFLRALLHVEPADCVAIRFSPHEGFVQTPGPSAGARL